MKKLLAVTPVALLLAACATNAPMNSSSTQAQTFTCDDNAKVTAAYVANGKVANLSLTLPRLGIKNQKVSLRQAVSGSGARYVKESSSTASYEWQTKAKVGILSIRSVNDRVYKVNCTLKR